MSGHTARTQTDVPVTPDSLLADRQRFLAGFASATFWGAVFVALLLIGMAVFLL